MEDDLISGLFSTKRDEESEFCSDYRGLYVQYKLIGPPYFLEWNGLSLYSTKPTEGQRLSLCQLRMEPSVVWLVYW